MHAHIAHPDPQREYEMLRAELASYSDELARKPFCVLITKLDLLPPEAAAPRVAAADAWGQFAISAVSRRGLDELLEQLWARVQRQVQQDTFEEPAEPYRP